MTEYKTWIKDLFDSVSLEYGKRESFKYFGEALVHYAVLSQGEHVLDVATGRGAIAFPASEMVGPTGRVAAIDISEKMIDEAKKEKAHDWLEFYEMDAEALTFDDEAFDVVFCGFGLPFLPHVDKALAQMKRVLKPGGCLALSIVAKRPALDLWVAQRAKALGARQKLYPFALENQQALQDLLEKAGFVEIEMAEETKTFKHEDANSWWQNLLSYEIRGLYEQLSPENQELLKQEALAKVSGEPSLLSQEQKVIYAAAEKPELI